MTNENKNTLEQERRFTILEEQGRQNLHDHKEVMDQVRLINYKLDNLDNRYSPKWVEKAVSSMIAVILISVIGAILSLVIQNQSLTN